MAQMKRQCCATVEHELSRNFRQERPEARLGGRQDFDPGLKHVRAGDGRAAAAQPGYRAAGASNANSADQIRLEWRAGAHR